MLFIAIFIILYNLNPTYDTLIKASMGDSNKIKPILNKQNWKLSSYSIEQENGLLEQEILPALSEFLRLKGELTKKTIDGIIYEAIIDLISRTEPREQVVDIVTGRSVIAV